MSTPDTPDTSEDPTKPAKPIWRVFESKPDGSLELVDTLELTEAEMEQYVNTQVHRSPNTDVVYQIYQHKHTVTCRREVVWEDHPTA